jgi:uncharacterized protein YndB with AHSA1/START domain
MTQPAASTATSTEEPVVITRDLELDVPADELWRLVSDGERWAEWLTDASDVVVEPAREGTVVDEDGLERRVSIHSVVPGHSVRFAWWPTGRPGESSVVELVVAPLAPDRGVDGDGRSRISITETYATATDASTTATASAAAWDLRLMLMVLCLDAVALVRT